jgi:trehalose/maltose hydrolase-like predicted phosphorylase
MSGTLNLVQHTYAGAHVREGTLRFSPRLPDELKRVSFTMQFEGTPIHVSVTHDGLTLLVHPEGVSRPIRVGFGDDLLDMSAGESCTFQLERPAGLPPTSWTEEGA